MLIDGRRKKGSRSSDSLALDIYSTRTQISSAMNRPTPAAPAPPPPSDVGSASDLQQLTLDEIGKANTSAQIEGVTAGVAAGFVSGQIALRLLRLSKNAALLSGLV